MSPQLSSFIDSLDRFVDDAPDGRLTHGQRIKLWMHFDAEFGPAAAARRDLLGALVAREIFKEWDPRWVTEAPFGDGDDEYRDLVEEFPIHFGSNFAATLDLKSRERQNLLKWCERFELMYDQISPLLNRKAKAILAFCAVLATQYRRLDEGFDREVCQENGWNSVDDVDPQYYFESDCGPITIEDGWERFCEHDIYAEPDVLAPDRRKAWHWWLSQVRLVCDDPVKARELI
jgi:hypothetical protein